MRKRYALFLGCTTPVKVPQYELAARWVCRHTGVELVDIDKFVCCGSNQANVSTEASLLLSAMNLAYAESRELDIIVMCAACYGTLAEAVERLKEPEIIDRINKKLSTIGLSYNGKVRVRHISRMIYEDIGPDRIKGLLKRDLSGLKLAPHYGCHYLKPRAISLGFDNPNSPRTLHRLIEATGCLSVDYTSMHLCCGGKTFPTEPTLAHLLVSTKLEELKKLGVDGMVVQCQTCYLMYGPQQAQISRTMNKDFNIPVILYPQLLGLAMGADPIADLGMNLNFPSVEPLLDKTRKLKALEPAHFLFKDRQPALSLKEPIRRSTGQ